MKYANCHKNLKKESLMKAIVVGLVLLSSSAFARDSQWSLCKTSTMIYEEKETLLLNRYEHRSNDGMGRTTDLTLIFGGHLLTGAFDSTEVDTGAVTLSSETSSFTGTILLKNNAVQLRGTLSLDGAETPLASNFRCEVLRD
jgi:hypothetical protein